MEEVYDILFQGLLIICVLQNVLLHNHGEELDEVFLHFEMPIGEQLIAQRFDVLEVEYQLHIEQGELSEDLKRHCFDEGFNEVHPGLVLFRLGK